MRRSCDKHPGVKIEWDVSFHGECPLCEPDAEALEEEIEGLKDKLKTAEDDAARADGLRDELASLKRKLERIRAEAD